MADSSAECRSQLINATTCNQRGHSEDDDSTEFDVMDIVRVRAKGGTADVYEELEAAKMRGAEAAAAENGDMASSSARGVQNVTTKERQENMISLGEKEPAQEEHEGECKGEIESELDQIPPSRLAALRYAKDCEEGLPSEAAHEEIPPSRLAALRYAKDCEDGPPSGTAQDQIPPSCLAALRYAKDCEEGLPSEAAQEEIPTPQQATRNRPPQPVAPRPGAYSGAPGTDLERLHSMRFSLVGILPELSHSAMLENQTTDGRKSSRTESSAMSPDGTLPATDAGNGLARATVVEEESVMDINLEQVDIDSLDRKKAAQTKQKTIFIMASIALLAMAVIISLVITFGLKKENSRVSNIPPTMTTTITPSTSPSVALSGPLDTLFGILPAYTKARLYDPVSPQSIAYTWLLNHRNISNLEEWRKVQLLALATIYYSWDGPNWPNGLSGDWLDVTRSECYWFSSTMSSWGQLTGAFHGRQGNSPCNEAGEIQILNLQDAFDLGGKEGSFPQEISLLTNMVELDLTGLGLNASLSDDVWPVVSSLAKLENLRLLSNSLTGTIPSELGTLSNLIHLNLGFNFGLSGSIPTELGLLSGMESLDLSANFLSGLLPSELSQLMNLEELDLSFNNLSGPIENNLLLLPSLQYLFLIDNSFSGSLPSEIGLRSNLRMLLFESNYFSRSLPSQCGLMTGLEYLNLNSNSLTGVIPSEISLLGNLTNLRLEGNRISGSIPTEVGMMGSMKILNLGANSLSGLIPTALGMLHVLDAIYLDRNMLSGPIPTEVGLLNDVTGIYFYDNMFSGQIPAEVGKLTSLVTLHLNGNMLTGKIPNMWTSLEFNSSTKPDFALTEMEQGWETDFLHELKISDNPLLTGTIPKDLCQMNTNVCSTYELNVFTDAWENKACALVFDCTDLLCGCGADCPCT